MWLTQRQPDKSKVADRFPIDDVSTGYSTKVEHSILAQHRRSYLLYHGFANNL